MKTKLLIISIAIALCLSAAPALAGPNGAGDDGGIVTLNRFSGYYDPIAWGGGEFTIYDSAQGGTIKLSNANYADVAKGVHTTESFQTFCVETGESAKATLNVWVSQASTSTPLIYGSGSHAYEGGFPGAGDDLNPKTAYLYTRFATGTLAALGYDYTPGTGREDSAEVLQNLIWGIEGETSGWVAPTTGLAGDLYDAAVASNWDATGNIGSVRVLQMWNSDYNYLQDHLFYVPVPGAVLLGILGLSVAGIKLRKYA